MLVKLQAVFVAVVVLVSQETKFDVNTNFHSIKDGGRSHAIDWGKIDNTYRKNNNESTWWATKKLVQYNKW